MLKGWANFRTVLWAFCVMRSDHVGPCSSFGMPGLIPLGRFWAVCSSSPCTGCAWGWTWSPGLSGNVQLRVPAASSAVLSSTQVLWGWSLCDLAITERGAWAKSPSRSNLVPSQRGILPTKPVLSPCKWSHPELMLLVGWRRNENPAAFAAAEYGQAHYHLLGNDELCYWKACK